MHEARTRPGGRIINTYAAQANITNAGTIVTVPAGKYWKVLYIWFHFGTTATVGVRSISAAMRTAANATFWKTPSQGPTASQHVEAMAGQSFAENTTAVDGLNGAYRWPLPEMYIPAGYNIIFDDAADIQPLDQLTYYVHAIEYDA